MFKWLFPKKKNVLKTDNRPIEKSIFQKNSFTHDEIAKEAERMLSNSLGSYTYHPMAWAKYISWAYKTISDQDNEITCLKRIIDEYKKEFASYRI